VRSAAFHAGEIEVQTRAGERQVAERNGQILGDEIPGGARPFLGQQSLVAVGALDGAGHPWASVVTGPPGFVASAPDGRAVALSTLHGQVAEGDPLFEYLAAGAEVALLGIELRTRRRLRVYGEVAEVAGDHVRVQVRGAYPNCPKYVQKRQVRAVLAPPGAPVRGVTLDARARALIERCDTLFIASRHATAGLDVSHRGGAPGFVEVRGQTLRVPDYAGNGMYNTLGNLWLDGRAGLALLDFERGEVLQVQGTARVLFDQAEDARHPAGGTGRAWELTVASWALAPLPLAAAPGVEPSPFNPRPE